MAQRRDKRQDSPGQPSPRPRGAARSLDVMKAPGWHERESFVGRDLRQATFDGHHFKMCDFKMCDFSGADLRGASLRGASFAFCNLRAADLRDADLTYAKFGRVVTHDPSGGRTDLTGARLEGAKLAHVTVDDAIGWPGE